MVIHTLELLGVMDWDNHRSQSNDDGGYLVVINDDDEMAFLASLNGIMVGWILLWRLNQEMITLCLVCGSG